MGLVSLKIVFNGNEYDSVDAMPPDVRKDYEVALETLRKSGGEEILSMLQRDMGVTGTHIKATVREIVVNGKKYASVEAMPPDDSNPVRAILACSPQPRVEGLFQGAGHRDHHELDERNGKDRPHDVPEAVLRAAR